MIQFVNNHMFVTPPSMKTSLDTEFKVQLDMIDPRLLVLNFVTLKESTPSSLKRPKETPKATPMD